MNDFFDLPSDNFVNKGNSGEKKSDPNVYNPDPNAFNGSYKSVFRFVPYIFNKDLSKYTKYSAKFYNPLTKESLFVDCPSNTGKPSILWDLERVIKGLKEEEPKLHEELSSRFSRWHTHHSIVYIKKDPQRPELEGTVKIFKFSAQINTLIESQIKPEENELLENVSSVNPYHLLQGKDFLCVVGKKTKTFRDWSKCKFMDDITPFIFTINGKQVVVENNEKSIKLVQEFLKKNTPKLDEYFNVEWTEETYVKVAEAIISTINNKAVINLLLERTKDEKMKELILQKMNSTSAGKKQQSSSAPAQSSSSIDEDIDFKKNTPITQEPASESTSEPTNEQADDEYDELFKDL